jgi:hypothetical protein
MNDQHQALHVLLGELEWNAFRDLNDIQDFIWKSPRLLAHETALEREKLATYFPDGGLNADIRWQNESKKLNETFPRLIAVGNLFSALSVFENYVLLLLKILQENVKDIPKQALGHGVAKHLEATKAYGVDPGGLKYYEQIRVAISIRNCLMHASGLLSAFGKAEALKAQVAQRRYMSSNTKSFQTERARPPSRDVVSVEASELGDKLVITNDYSHTVCSYLREYFSALCGSLNPDTSLRPLIYYLDPLDVKPKPPHQGPIM